MSQANVIGNNFSNFGPRRVRSNNFSNNFDTNANRLHQNPLNNARAKSHNVNRFKPRSRNNFNTNNFRNTIHIKTQPNRFQQRRFTRRKYSDKQQKRALQTLAVCKNTKTASLLREYEILYQIPLLLYMYDIMGSLRISHKIQTQNIDTLLPLLPCDGGYFRNLLRYKQSKTGRQHFLTDNKMSISSEIKQLLTLSRQEYASNLQQVPLPQSIKFKVNGIWETDVKLIRAFNAYLDSLFGPQNDKNSQVFKGAQCEYHLRIWSNGLIKQKPKLLQLNECVAQNNCSQKPKTKNQNHCSESSSDDEDADDPYKGYEEIKTARDDEFYPRNVDVDIAELMQANQKKMNIKILKRKLKKIEQNEDKPEELDITDGNDWIDFDIGYEPIDEFVARVCRTAALPIYGDAIMILIDTRNDPDICVYVWRKHIMKYDDRKHNINIGDSRLNYKKQKYFDLQHNGNVVNVGQYIGLTTCILDGFVHQFWSIFNREVRFEPIHSWELWPEFYENQTLFEVKTDFDGCDDEKEQEKYKTFYGSELINKLDQRKCEFDYHQIAKIEEEVDEKLEQSENDIFDDDFDDGSPPDLRQYEPFKFHKINTRIIFNLKQDLKHPERHKDIKDLSPKQYKRVQAHAVARKFNDVPNDDIDET